MANQIPIVASLNINGLNNNMKQLQLIDFMKYNKINILLIQEHNIRNTDTISPELSDFCEVILNPAIALKGGTAILIDRRLAFNINHIEKSADSRVISLKLNIYNKMIHLINIYAHSNNVRKREELFNNDLIYYLRNSLDNTILGGDWNCVLSQRDTESVNTNISKALLNLKDSLKLKDIWFIENNMITYTYIRDNYGSRLDRVYVKDTFVNYINNIKVIHTSLSDHSCIKFNLNIPNIPKPGKYFWKLNVSLLSIPEIDDKFKEKWIYLTSFIVRYNSVNEWWESYAKKQIKFFFIEMGKIENRKKYDTLHYFEYCLNKLYNKLNIEGQIDYKRVKDLKYRINHIKNEILEGVKIRSRMEEQLKGEQVSSYLIKKQSDVKARQFMTKIKAESNIMENLREGTVLTNKDSINLYVREYYQLLYKKEAVDGNEQEFFLNLVQNILTEEDISELNKDITENEIYNAIKNMNINKSPGIDGLPIEFYLHYWYLIKKEICQIIKNNINGLLLGESQRKAIITLIPKEGDLSILKTWRPISLLCCDVKIISKILAIRLQPLMEKIISPNQYCIKDRSINECTSKMRDVMYYCEKENLTGAAINLDFEKAFDRVEWSMLVKIMNKMGFPVFIINWLKVLFSNIESVCMINGTLSVPFKIERGVRQGCPLSMLLFVIFQEPLFKAFQISNIILPPLTIEKQKCLGYADDTTIFIRSVRSVQAIFALLKKFEKATNSKINIDKTKIYGFGDWHGKMDWPVTGMKVEQNHFKTLGIIFSCNYDKALEDTWKQVTTKIRRRIPLIKTRNLTIYQK